MDNGLRKLLEAIAIVIAILGLVAFWNDRGSDTAVAASAMHQSISSNSSRNDTQDQQIAETQKDIKEVKKEQHRSELSRVQMTGDIKQTKNDVGNIMTDFKELKNYLMQYDYDNKKE